MAHPFSRSARYERDPRTVLTLDAGGTNLTFSAIAGNRQVAEAVTLPACGDDLGACLGQIVEGFSRVWRATGGHAAALSFAFPGPADYPAGIIGDLPNLPGFRGGVPLGPMLEERFGVPVFINNDGDLFTYGEALSGLLPEVNQALTAAGSPKRFRNLLGVTLGTGFGGGIVRDGELLAGDNSAAGEIWLMRKKLAPLTAQGRLGTIRRCKRLHHGRSATALSHRFPAERRGERTA